MSALSFLGPGRGRVAASIAVIGVGAFVAAAPATAASSGSRTPRAPAIGTLAVGRAEQTFVDETRPTQANGDFAGAPNRTLHTTIYYPARGKAGDSVTPDAPPDRKRGPYPLIVYSHGHNSFGAEFEPLLRQWASAGYVVAAPDFPLSNKNAPGGATAADLPQQPADARFVIDRMLALNAKRSGTFSGIVDPKRIGASGHSLGAMTTYRLVYDTCCADKRVKAAAPMSGIAADPPQFFAGISTPLLAEHGDADGTLPYQSGADSFAKAGPPKFFLTLIGGGHTPPFRGAPEPAPATVAHVTLDFFDRYLKNDRSALERLREDAHQPGVATLQEQAR
jgi:dienelactone hydrolase